jgi:histidine triad (HIT) family protein
MKDCVFCYIVKGVSPANIAYSDDKVMAFMDIQPVNPGHVLVIPKAHAANLSELDGKTGGPMFKVAMRISEALRRTGLKCEGVTCIWQMEKPRFKRFLTFTCTRFQGSEATVSA